MTDPTLLQLRWRVRVAERTLLAAFDERGRLGPDATPEHDEACRAADDAYRAAIRAVREHPDWKPKRKKREAPKE